MTALPTHDDVRAAAARLAGRIVRTPMLRHPVLDAAVGGTVLVKPEPLQRTGSFKLRGATNAVLRLTEAQRRGGVVTHSSGNHGQAIACAAAGEGVRALIAMPGDAPAIKVESTRRWGAEITFFDRATTDRETLAARLAEERGGTVLPPFDHPDVIAGQGTTALELFEDAAAAGLHLDALAVCTGGGGLVAGCALAAEGASPGTQVYAVEPEGWDDTARSLASGERERADGQGATLCDSLLSLRPGELTFAVNRPRLAGAAVVTPSEVFAAMRFAFDHLKIVAEPGGAVALAAVLAGKIPARGRTVGVVISGGNVDPAVFARALAA
ncbi:threonine ammonia-lyase [Muricoccus radiodurans]|uniref:threonine ammonia-lyase n=1 Tax=Muricoccus radiodurans TaxID=2231721 RepID=UPI003CE78F21